MADTQLYHLGELLKAALNAAAASSVDTSYPYRLPGGAAWTRHPCLELYRESENFTRRGNASQRLREVVVKVNYYIGMVNGAEQLNNWAGYLQSRVQVVDDTIESGFHTAYAAGATLDTLADIEAIEVQSVDYDYAETGGAVEGAYPALSFTVHMTHRYTRYVSDAERLAGIDATLHMPDTSEPVELGEGTIPTTTDSGADGVITATGTFFSSATAAFSASHVGWYIRVADATNEGNNGDHEITAIVSGVKVVIGNSTTLVNEASLHWSLSEEAVP